MSLHKKDKQYFELVRHILKSKIFKRIARFKHHGTNRMIHSLRVSYYSYKIAKLLGLDYKSAAISGLLHDFYLCDDKKGFINYLKFQIEHPKMAAHNAVKYFEVSIKEKNIIETHMCPFTRPSKYIEGWVISIVDKSVAAYEYSKIYKKQLKI